MPSSPVHYIFVKVYINLLRFGQHTIRNSIFISTNMQAKYLTRDTRYLFIPLNYKLQVIE